MQCELRWVFAYLTNGTSPNKWLKLENTFILSSYNKSGLSAQKLD